MGTNRDKTSDQNQLLLSLAHQLRQPLLHIARQAEYGHHFDTEHAQESLAHILTSAESALTLIDNYALSLQAATRGEDWVREPVSVAAVLSDAADQLSPAARQYGVKLELDTASKVEQVHVNRRGLEAAFVSLGHALIEALATTGAAAKTPLRLSSHRCRTGVVGGLYCGKDEITVEAFRRSQALHGEARQPHLQLSAGSGAGIFVADSLFKVMATELKVLRHNRQYGLAAILPSVKQARAVQEMAHVLLVDPDRPLTAMYEKVLVGGCHSVAISCTAQGGVFAADDQQPDIVLLELQLAGHSGIEFLYEFRSYAEWQDVPVLIVSHVPAYELRQSFGLLKGHLAVSGYYYKPQLRLRELLRVVDDTIKVS